MRLEHVVCPRLCLCLLFHRVPGTLRFVSQQILRRRRREQRLLEQLHDNRHTVCPTAASRASKVCLPNLGPLVLTLSDRLAKVDRKWPIKLPLVADAGPKVGCKELRIGRPSILIQDWSEAFKVQLGLILP
jgi:hypothetical protein